MGEFHHVVEGGSAGGEDGFEVFKHLLRLRPEVVLAHHRTAGVHRHLPGYVNCAPAAHLHGVAVAGRRLTGWIDEAPDLRVGEGAKGGEEEEE